MTLCRFYGTSLFVLPVKYWCSLCGVVLCCVGGVLSVRVFSVGKAVKYVCI